MPRAFLIRLHRDRGAQILPIILFGLIAMVLMIGMVLNTGVGINNRTKAQDGADAAALTQAAWVARSLNVMSMNNVGLTQVYTVAAVSGAASWALFTLGNTARQAIGDCKSTYAKIILGIIATTPPPFDVAAVAAAETAEKLCMVPAGLALVAVLAITTVHAPPYRLGWALAMVDAINDMNDEIVNQFPAFSGQIAQNLMQRNGIDAIRFDPPCSQTGLGSSCQSGGQGVMGPDLPLQRDNPVAAADLCWAAEGSYAYPANLRENFIRHGFAAGTGPYTAGGEKGESLRDWEFFRGTLPGIGVSIGSFYKLSWLGIVVTFPTLFDVESAYGPTQSLIVGGPNDWYSKMDTTWKGACAGTTLATLIPIPGISEVLPHPYWLKTKIGATLRFTQSASPAQRQSQFSVLALAAIDRGAPVFGARFLQPMGPFYGYGQAYVYNLTSFDLYTQDWRARLVPATLMKNSGAIATALDDAPAIFANLKSYFQETSNANSSPAQYH